MPGAELQVASSPGMATSWAATRAREDQLFRPGAAPSLGPAATFSLGPIARAASPRPGGFVNLGKQRRQAAPTAGPVPPPPTTLGPIETNDAIKADGGWNDVRPPSVAHLLGLQQQHPSPAPLSLQSPKERPEWMGSELGNMGPG